MGWHANNIFFIIFFSFSGKLIYEWMKTQRVLVLLKLPSNSIDFVLSDINYFSNYYELSQFVQIGLTLSKLIRIGLNLFKFVQTYLTQTLYWKFMIAPILTMPSFPPLCFKTSLNISSPAMPRNFSKKYFSKLFGMTRQST